MRVEVSDESFDRQSIGSSRANILIKELEMDRVNCLHGRWSIGPCACSDDTVHFHYGNAMLHILVEDMRDLGDALHKLAERLDSRSSRVSSASARKSPIQ